jgi:hypothetical protein
MERRIVQCIYDCVDMCYEEVHELGDLDAVYDTEDMGSGETDVLTAFCDTFLLDYNCTKEAVQRIIADAAGVVPPCSSSACWTTGPLDSPCGLRTRRYYHKITLDAAITILRKISQSSEYPEEDADETEQLDLTMVQLMYKYCSERALV